MKRYRSNGSWIKLQSEGIPIRRRLGELDLALIAENARELRKLDLYERELLDAFVRTNHADWSLSALRRPFAQADRARLRAAGDPLPGTGPFRIYRGVAGPEPERRVLGLSWTQSIEQARWFAETNARRFDRDHGDPGVYCVMVGEGDVLAYIDRREEGEFIVSLPAVTTPERLE